MPRIRHFTSFRNAIVTVLLLMATAGSRLEAQGDTPVTNPPPMALPATVDVQRGKTVEIRLQSQGKYGETVSFILRGRPLHGTLEEPRRVDRISGSVIYRHNGGADHIEDSFTFATQAEGTPVSAPAKVTIRVIDPPPALEAEPRLSFGPIPVGDSQTKILKVKNIGGLPLSSKLDILPPFSFGPGFNPQYTLQGGATMEVPLVYTPRNPGESSIALKLGAGRSELTLLSGRATAPFSLSPDTLYLRNTPRDLSAAMTVSNLTNDPLTVKFTWPEGFEGPAEATLPAAASLPVNVRLTSTNPRELTGSVKVERGGLTLETTLNALALPGRLEAPSEVDLGLTRNAAESMKKVMLKNVGGGPLMLEVRREGDFVVPNLKEVLPMEPGDFYELEVFPPQGQKGGWSGRLILSEKTLGQHIITIGGTVENSQDRPAAAAPPRSTPPPRTVTGSRVPKAAGTSPPPAAVAEPEPQLPAGSSARIVSAEEFAQITAEKYGADAAKFLVEKSRKAPIMNVRPTAATTRTITLAWPKSDIAVTDIGVQIQSLSTDGNSHLQLRWLPAKAGDVTRGLEQDSVQVSELPAGRELILRLVRASTAAGDPNAAEALSAPVIARTQRSAPLIFARPGFRNVLLVLLVIAAVGGFFWMRLKRR